MLKGCNNFSTKINFKAYAVLEVNIWLKQNLWKLLTLVTYKATDIIKQ